MRATELADSEELPNWASEEVSKVLSANKETNEVMAISQLGELPTLKPSHSVPTVLAISQINPGEKVQIKGEDDDFFDLPKRENSPPKRTSFYNSDAPQLNKQESISGID